jgi:hypothetical protein
MLIIFRALFSWRQNQQTMAKIRTRRFKAQLAKAAVPGNDDVEHQMGCKVNHEICNEIQMRCRRPAV